MKFDMQVNGLAEMERFLKTLPDEVSRKMLYGALMGGAKPIMDQAKANVRANFGNSARFTSTLEESLVRGRQRKTGLAARVNVKIRKGKVKDRMIKAGVIKPHGDDAFYGRFLEFGTSKMPAYPFLKPAADAKAGEATNRFRDTLMKRMGKWCKESGVVYRTYGGTS